MVERASAIRTSDISTSGAPRGPRQAFPDRVKGGKRRQRDCAGALHAHSCRFELTVEALEVAAFLRHFKHCDAVKMIEVEPHKISCQGFPTPGMRRAFDDKEAKRVTGHGPQIPRGFAQRCNLCRRVVAASRESKRFAFDDDVLLSRRQVEKVRLPGPIQNRLRDRKSDRWRGPARLRTRSERFLSLVLYWRPCYLTKSGLCIFTNTTVRRSVSTRSSSSRPFPHAKA